MASNLIIALDFDGVITRLDVDWEKVREQVSRILGRKVSSLIELLESSFGTDLFYTLSSLVRTYEEESIERAVPFEDAVLFLKNAEHVKVYIATMQPRDLVHRFMSRYGLLRYVHDILGRDEFGSKLNQLRFILDAEKIDPCTLMLIDDSYRNILYARLLGARFIWLRRGRGMTLLSVLRVVRQLTQRYKI